MTVHRQDGTGPAPASGPLPRSRSFTIAFTPDSRSDIGSGWERAWQAGRVDLAALSATDLRYGFFSYPVDFIVEGHAFLSAARPPLTDIMFTSARSLHSLRDTGSAEIDFTENTYVIRLERAGDQVRFTPSYNAPTPRPRCSFDAYLSGVRSFVTDGVEYLEMRYPALAVNPAMHELRALVQVPVGDRDARGGGEGQ
ncbi:hypothetical protein ACH5AI_05230 [Streptomyces collinus]|uniref:hypothetical protein n=1 Tax=Streptomyces collinus TaxID=42684 RepID=UPI0037A87E6B